MFTEDMFFTFLFSRAIRLLPSYGNPHNQLAVLSVYSDDDFQAVYHYFRSLSVAHPFLTARDNLTVLFEKNRQKFLESVNTQKYFLFL
jgi:protein SMG7